MTRIRHLLATAGVVLAVATLGLDAGLGKPAGRINVRWADAAADSDRLRLEQELHLAAARQQEGRTWSYRLRDTSRDNIERLVRNPLVADTHNIDRGVFAIARDPSGTPEWVRRVNRVPTLRRVSHLYPQLAVFFALVALVAAWPAITSGVFRVRPAMRLLEDPAWTARALAIVLGASLALRLILVWSGGQFYWPDEGRYDQSRKVVQDFAAGNYPLVLIRLDTPDALFFKLMGLVPATIEYLVRFDTRIPAVFFSIFSVLNIWLVARIARRLGAGSAEALFAAVLVALSSSFFYYVRHLFPYDIAMTSALLAIYVGVNPRATAGSSMICGILAACTFYLYAGYWLLTATSLLVHALDARSMRDALRRVMWSGIGAGAVIGAVLGVNAAVGGHLVEELVSYAGTINQGAFSEGWRVTFEYLWHAEHLLLIAWIAAVVYWASRPRVILGERRVWIPLAALITTYALLVVASTGLHAFVVYGRTARALVPFLCLLTAAALERMRTSASPVAKRLVPAALAVFVLQSAFNFAAPLAQVFPARFLEEADEEGDNEIAGVKTIYTAHIYPLPEPFTMPPGYAVLKEAQHPLQYVPYQYEGYDPAQRRALRSTDIRMRVIAPATE